MNGAPVLTAALERLLLERLTEEWSLANYHHFGDGLRPVAMRLDDSDTHLGTWDRRARTITLSRGLVTQHPWSAVTEVLRHEMAHQYVDEVLHVTGETAHGPAFQHVCARIGVDPAASGLPRGVKVEEEDRILRRITRLLALAESPNTHEAEAAMAAARRLMLTYNLDHVNRPTGYVFRQLGTPTARQDAHERHLGGLLMAHFFVRGIWVKGYDVFTGKSGTVLEISGTPSNVEIATYVHGFLLETGERLWRQHRIAHQISGDRDRRRFLVGVMLGFDNRLVSETRTSAELGLVWVGDRALDAFYERRHPRRTSRRASQTVADSSFHAGVNAGRQIVLHKPIHDSGGSGPRRLLTGD